MENFSSVQEAVDGRHRRAIAATLSAAPGEPVVKRSFVGELIGVRLIGDGLVPVDSALGHHPDPELALDF